MKTTINHSDAVLYHLPIAELHTVVEKESVDIILTDPPYPKEFLPQWGELAEFAAYALKPGGHLFAMTGHVWLPQVFEAMNVEELNYVWCHAMGFLKQGKRTNIGRRIPCIWWKPILWYVKPPHCIHEQCSDWIPVGSKDKGYHEWGQGGGDEWIAILDRIKRPKPAVICDPFIGGGTTALIAAQEGYPFIGADIDETCIQTTTERLNTRQMTLL